MNSMNSVQRKGDEIQMEKTGRTGPLRHIRVLDLSQTLAGPFASTILSDLGAEVIKIEKPGLGDQTRHFAPYQEGESHYFLSINRNKKSVVIDLKTEEGKKTFLELVEKCDVVLENFRPGVLEGLGLGTEVIKSKNPEIIICSISAFGKTGPLGDMAGYDLLIQAMSGVMSVTGEKDNPMRCGLPIGDLIGGLYGAITILGAVVEKDRTGKGLVADLSLLDNLVSLLGYFGGKYFMTGETAAPVGSHHPFIVPYGTYKASDGFLVLAIYTEKFWKKFVTAIDKVEWLEDDAFITNEERVKNKDLLIGKIQFILEKQPISEWAKKFDAYDIPYAPILNVEQVLNHPQVQARELIKEVSHSSYGNFKYVGTPIKYENYALDNNNAAPVLGEHTEEVLMELLNYKPNEEINNLMAHSSNKKN